MDGPYFEYGDLSHLSYLGSVRKNILAMLYGRYVENGTIQLSKTLREIGFTGTTSGWDRGPSYALNTRPEPSEQRARPVRVR